MKRPLAFLLTMALLLGCFALLPTRTQAANYSGTCGENLTWALEGTKLVISGTGPMYDYSEDNLPPWATVIPREVYISSLVIDEGVTSIGEYAFATENFGYIRIPASVTSVGSQAFCEDRGYFYFFGQSPVFAEDAFLGTDGVTIRTVGWDDTVKQNYGGTNITWLEAEISLVPTGGKRQIELGGIFQPEDFAFHLIMSDANRTTYAPFVPWDISIGEYDNSSVGLKEVIITVHDKDFVFSYLVTDGTSHLDDLDVQFPNIPQYWNSGLQCIPVIHLGSQLLTKDIDYTYTTRIDTEKNCFYVTVTGIGILAGYEKTFYCPILKRDISDARVQADNTTYQGEPVQPRLSAHETGQLDKDTEFTVQYQNNINIGTATARVVGVDQFYGSAETTFQIKPNESIVTLLGNYLGNAEGEVSDDIHVSEMFLSPGPLSAHVDYSGIHAAAYGLYRIDDDGMTLIEERSGLVGYWSDTNFLYDFSYVYEDAVETGGEIYVLSYSWVTETGEVYGGALYLYVFSKVPDATAMMMTHVENDGDFRKEYLNVLGLDGVVGKLTWSSTDSTIASVQDGILTLNKPGTVTISAQYKDMICTADVTVNQLYLTDGYIFDYSSETGTARVIYDGRILTAGTDYTLSVEQTDAGTVVSATGRGLFTGELQKTFSGPDSLADPHSHTFDDYCDNTCNSCDYTRDREHRFSEDWSKDTLGHWHACLGCGKQADYAAHTKISDTACSVCGTLFPKGDVNMDMAVNRDDVIALLLHVSMPGDFPLSVSADYTGDGKVTRDDVIKLLLHISMPDDFPL